MTISIMATEAAEAPQVVKRQYALNQTVCEQLGSRIRKFAPSFVYIVGRGSSDHAGVFAKYLIEIELGIAVCASAPSVSTIYGTQLTLNQALVIVISQSGRSPDILSQTVAAKNSGALCVALVNDQSSPLAELVDVVLPLHAGPELAIAATKSYIATLHGLLMLVAYWKQDQALIASLAKLPGYLQQTIDAPMQLPTAFVQPLVHCVVLGRGFGYAIAREIALKLKEVCGVHAEAFSSAEFFHGPIALVEKKLAIIDVCVQDESCSSQGEQMDEVKRRGGQLCRLSQLSSCIEPRLAPITIVQRFYLDIQRIAVDMGKDPDNPIGLKKVTRTV